MKPENLISSDAYIIIHVRTKITTIIQR